MHSKTSVFDIKNYINEFIDQLIVKCKDGPSKRRMIKNSAKIIIGLSQQEGPHRYNITEFLKESIVLKHCMTFGGPCSQKNFYTKLIKLKLKNEQIIINLISYWGGALADKNCPAFFSRLNDTLFETNKVLELLPNDVVKVVLNC